MTYPAAIIIMVLMTLAYHSLFGAVTYQLINRRSELRINQHSALTNDYRYTIQIKVFGIFWLNAYERWYKNYTTINFMFEEDAESYIDHHNKFKALLESADND